MKISAFHKKRGDKVVFVKGLKKDMQLQMWDRIYITSLFSFFWNQTIKTIKYYEFSVKDPQNLFIGGPMATIMTNEIKEATGYKSVKGLLNERGKVRLPYDFKIDNIVPDYSMLEEIDYKYPTSNAYFSYITRGCIRKCPFCAVPKIEPTFTDYIPLQKQLSKIKKLYGEKKDLMLLDNNVLASPKFDQIIDEIKDAGFIKGALLNNRLRYVDFNQGIDLRLLTKKKMKRLSELPIKPLRIAFDHIKLKDRYIEKIEWAAEFGILQLSNYILYNFNDTPNEFYERLKINVELNKRLGTKIFSFPMRYIPVTNKNRKYCGKYWTPRYLRSIQCILNVTHGVVGPRKEFFKAAFGKNLKEFNKLLIMPDNYIIYRENHKNNGAADWWELYRALSPKQKKEFLKVVHENNFADEIDLKYPKVRSLLSHYKYPKAKTTDDLARSYI